MKKIIYHQPLFLLLILFIVFSFAQSTFLFLQIVYIIFTSQFVSNLYGIKLVIPVCIWFVSLSMYSGLLFKKSWAWYLAIVISVGVSIYGYGLLGRFDFLVSSVILLVLLLLNRKIYL